jgi:hypothetical protein
MSAHTTHQTQTAPPVEVMIVGTFHMSNPGKDLHNMSADDVLAPKRQAEIEAATNALAKFRPTVVAVEWPAPLTTERYNSYLAGTLAPSHNEVVQLGFRLAKKSGLKSVNGVDVDGDFPFEAVQTYAKSHGQQAILDKAGTDVQALVDQTNKVLTNGTVGGTLRFINDPVRISNDNGFYRTMLRIGDGTNQPGADLLTAWYKRNFLISANLVQLAKPGDRIVVFYGFGHCFLLRQAVSEMPGFKLVEPNHFLPH